MALSITYVTMSRDAKTGSAEYHMILAGGPYHGVDKIGRVVKLQYVIGPIKNRRTETRFSFMPSQSNARLGTFKTKTMKAMKTLIQEQLIQHKFVPKEAFQDAPVEKHEVVDITAELTQ